MDFLLGLLAWGAFWIVLATLAAQWGWVRTWFLGWIMAGGAFGFLCMAALMVVWSLISGIAMPIGTVAILIASGIGFWYRGGALLALRRRQENALFDLLQSQGRSTVDLSREQQ